METIIIAKLFRLVFALQDTILFSAKSIAFTSFIVLLSACSSAPFGSQAQYRVFNAMMNQMVQLREQDIGGSAPSEHRLGLMTIFETNGDEVSVRYVENGESPNAAMRALITNHIDPCGAAGTRERIVGFAPPSTVALPISFIRCTTLLDQVRQEIMVSSDLDRLNSLLYKQAKINDVENATLHEDLMATTDNTRRTTAMAEDIERINTVQQQSWDQTISLLKEMSQNILRSGK